MQGWKNTFSLAVWRVFEVNGRVQNKREESQDRDLSKAHIKLGFQEEAPAKETEKRDKRVGGRIQECLVSQRPGEDRLKERVISRVRVSSVGSHMRNKNHSQGVATWNHWWSHWRVGRGTELSGSRWKSMWCPGRWFLKNEGDWCLFGNWWGRKAHCLERLNWGGGQVSQDPCCRPGALGEYLSGIPFPHLHKDAVWTHISPEWERFGTQNRG